jgi:hypothetical protein
MEAAGRCFVEKAAVGHAFGVVGNERISEPCLRFQQILIEWMTVNSRPHRL